MAKKCEVNFLDVGQGACSVIIYGKRRGIVIDCAGNSLVPLGVLQQFVDVIDYLIISHHDWDHAGGAKDIISNYCSLPGKRMGQVIMLLDRPPTQKRLKEFLHFCDQLHAAERLLEPARVEKGWKARKLHGGLRLHCHAPSFWGNVHGLLKRDNNASCAVIELTCGKQRILFAGDAPFREWEKLHEAWKGERKPFNAVVVPHHGGRLGSKSTSIRNAFRYFNQIIQADVAIVSVGTKNGYDHPNQHVILAARLSKAHVLCTQITSQCGNLASVPNGVTTPTKFSLSGSTRKRSSVACAGSISVTLGGEKPMWGNAGRKEGEICGFVDREDHLKAVNVFRERQARPTLCQGMDPRIRERQSV